MERANIRMLMPMRHLVAVRSFGIGGIFGGRGSGSNFKNVDRWNGEDFWVFYL